MEEKLFHEVVIAKLTQTPDPKAIQEEIAYGLGLSFEMNDNVQKRAGHLCKRLKNENRVLVILDNIWAKLDLETVGIPSGGDERGQCCTILLTSRDQHLLCNEMNSEKIFLVEVLSDEESMGLFWKTVGDHDSTQTSDFQTLAVEVVRKCGGLPIAIKTVAVALKNKSLSVWKDALNQLRNSNPRHIRGMTANVYSSIQLSYNFLESGDAKSLFRLCALQNEGSQIPINDLMIYGMGFGWFTNRLEEGRNRVHTLIDNLKTSCLLLDGDNEHVKMHDVIHDVAVSIAAEEHMFNIQDVDDLKEELEKVMQKDPTAISLPYREIQELPERLECPKLELFLLFAKSKLEPNSLQISDLFFEGMKELRVLHLTRIRFLSIASSLGCLTNLRTLSLNYFNSREDVAIIGKLTKLQILSFRNSNIKQLPLEIGQLTRLKLLDLSNCWSLKVIAPTVISKLSRLEELYMGNSFTHWEKGEGGSNASLDELRALSKLTTLDLNIPNVRVMPQDLVSVELERFKICIGDWWPDWWDLKSLAMYERMLTLSGLDKSIILGGGMQKLLKNIEYLRLYKLIGFQNVVNELHDREDFQQLKHLYVENDSEILYIVNSVGQIAFPLLESLFLDNLTNLGKLCQGQLTEDRSFSKLRIINVEGCHGLEHLFSFSMAQNCFRLREIQVTNCKNLKMIVGEESEIHIFRENESINFSQLQSLKLGDLPKLTSLGFDQEITRTLSATPSASKEIVAEDDREDFMTVLFNNKVIFSALEKLELRSINIEKIWLDPFSTMSTSPCQNLIELRVEKCSRLEFLFTYSMVRSLVRLKKLVIENCESMEMVINTTGLGRDEEQMIDSEVFPKLMYLELSDLPKLTRFMSMSSSNSEENNILHTGTQSALFDEKWYHQLTRDSFSKLKGLVVVSCNKLTSVFSSNIIMGRRFESLQFLSVADCNSIEDIIEEATSFSSSSRRFDVFPQLIELILLGLLKLKSIYEGIRILEWRTLKKLSIVNCEKVEILFASLELLEGQQSIILVDHRKVALPCLRELKLFKLPKLLHLWKENSHPSNVFEYLEILEISKCHKLRQLVPSSFTFDYLTTLEVSKCDGLINLVTLSTAKSLANLTRMNVNDCKMIEEIMQQQVGEEVKKDCIVFSKLQYLGFSCLPSLTSFCLGNYTLEFPSLEHVFVENYPKMEIFSRGVLSTPNLQRLELTELDSEEEGRLEGSLNFTIQKLFQEMNSKEEN